MTNANDSSEGLNARGWSDALIVVGSVLMFLLLVVLDRSGLLTDLFSALHESLPGLFSAGKWLLIGGFTGVIAAAIGGFLIPIREKVCKHAFRIDGDRAQPEATTDFKNLFTYR